MHASVPAPAPVNGEEPLGRFAEFCAAPYFRSLDGLRAIAIALVVLHHSPRSPSPWLAVLQENGRHGVSLFFVISGFLICTLLLREERQTGKMALGRFYGRRAARLLPLYYSVLALHAVAVLGTNVFSAEGEQLFRDKLPSYLFYYSNWLPTATQGPFFYAWSLAVEEQFYLTFGLLLFALPRLFLIAAAAGALLLKFVVFQSFGAVDTQSAVWRILFSYQEPILLGVLLGFALNSSRIFEFTHRWLDPPGVRAGIWTAVAGWVALHPITAQSAWDAQLLFLLMTIGVAMCVVQRGPAWLGHGFVAHVGRVSYGIYLLHWLVLVAIARVLPPSEWFAADCFVLTLVIVIPVASLVHRYFELPIIAYFKRRPASGRIDSAASAAPAHGTDFARRETPTVAPPAVVRPLPPF